MRHGTNWWTADHRGAPGWLIVAAALFLAACIAVVAIRPGSTSGAATSAELSSETPFAIASRGPETFVSALGSSSSFVPAQWWDESVVADEIPGVYADHVGVYPVVSTATLQKRVKAVSRTTDYVMVQSGTGDVLGGRTPRETVSALRALWKGVRTHDAKPIAALVAPSDALPEQTSELNRLIERTAKAQHVEVLDVYKPVVAADGTWANKMSADGVNPNAKASRLMAKAAIRQLKDVIKTDPS